MNLCNYARHHVTSRGKFFLCVLLFVGDSAKEKESFDIISYIKLFEEIHRPIIGWWSEEEEKNPKLKWL
jgi:hypothetical protein